MAIQCSCPHCQASYRLPETQLGKRVRCKGCGETFLVQQEEDVPVLEEASVDDVRRLARPARREETLDEYDDDRYADRPRSAPPPPPPPSRRYDEGDDPDDYEEEPRAGGGGSALVVVGVILVILLLLGVGGGLAAYFALSGKPDDQAGINPPLPLDVDKGKIGIPPFVPPNRDRDKQPVDPPIQPPIQPPVEDNSPPKDVAAALVMVHNFRAEKKRMALDFLLTAPVNAAQREEVERALEPLQSERQYSETVDRVLARWSPESEMKRIEKRLEEIDRNTWMRAMAQLANRTDERAMELLAGQLEKTFREDEAAKYLTKAGKRCEKFVLPYYNDPRSRTQDMARKILTDIGTTSDVKAKQCLADLDAIEEKPDALNENQRNSKRQAILTSLMNLKATSDKDVAAKISKHLEVLITDKDFFTADKAIDAMATWGQPDAIPALVEVANKDAGRKTKALKVLFKFKDDERVIPVMLSLLSERQHRLDAAKSLVSLGEKAEKAILERQKLIETTNEKDTRQAVYTILAEIGGRDSIKMLQTMAKLEQGRGGDKDNARIALAAANKISERLKLPK